MFDSTNYVITAGWWCGKANNEVRKLHGSDKIRDVGFFKLWKESILANSKPKKILLLDSASPIRPQKEDLEGIEFLSIDKNPGHSTNHSGKFCGYTRSIIMGVTYAELCDADYWVYVEQDALLKGRGILEHCISKMKTPYMFGSGYGTPQMLQQSLCIIRKDGFAPFLQRLRNIEKSDKEVAPEIKFIIASSKLLSKLPLSFFNSINTFGSIKGNIVRKVIRTIQKMGASYDYLPIGYGRTRPIDFEQPYYYFQHGSEEELKDYCSKI